MPSLFSELNTNAVFQHVHQSRFTLHGEEEVIHFLTKNAQSVFRTQHKCCILTYRLILFHFGKEMIHLLTKNAQSIFRTQHKCCILTYRFILFHFGKEMIHLLTKSAQSVFRTQHKWCISTFAKQSTNLAEFFCTTHDPE